MKSIQIRRKKKEPSYPGATPGPHSTPAPSPAGSYEPVKPKAGAFRVLPFLVILGIILALSAAYDFFCESDPFRICEAYLKQNAQIRQEFGEVRDVKPWFPFSIDTTGQQGRASLSFLVEGTTGSTTARATLTRQRGTWRILTASYEDRQGMTRSLAVEAPRSERSGDVPSAARSLSVSEPLRQGLQYMKENNLEKAVAAFSQAVEADPGSDLAYSLRGRALAKQNQDARAVADLNRAVALNPRNADAFNWLGWIHSRKNRNDEAIAALTKAIELRPNNGWAYYNRGRCFYRKGETAKSMEDARMACTLGVKDACKVYDRLKKT
jgi:tetratricopeptide (TPR) repeat protein